MTLHVDYNYILASLYTPCPLNQILLQHVSIVHQVLVEVCISFPALPAQIHAKIE